MYPHPVPGFDFLLDGAAPTHMYYPFTVSICPPENYGYRWPSPERGNGVVRGV